MFFYVFVRPIYHSAVIDQNRLIQYTHYTLSGTWLLVLVYYPASSLVCLFGVLVGLFARWSLCS